MRRAALALLAPAVLAAATVPLREGWTIEGPDGKRYPTSVPSTVIGALVANHVYPDPYFGMNLRSIPGTSYLIASNFSNQEMPADSPFRNSWRYRTEFQVPAAWRGKTLRLGFDGINFRANVWLNGRQIARSDGMAGTWRLFEFDVTGIARPGESNSLEVEVFPPNPHDLAITFVDWNPLPADKDMGIWRDVWLSATGPVAVRFPAVFTQLDPSGAQLTVRAELRNAADRPVSGVLRGKIESAAFSQPVDLQPHETRVVHAAVRINKPRLWWPAEVGAQELYPLDLEFRVGNEISDSSHTRFGIREVSGTLDENGHLLFRINGRKILIRGAGYTFDMLLRSSPERQEAELRYVRDMHLNAVRFEGKLEDDHFLDLADRYGILVLAGWCCCDHWEKWKAWNEEDEQVAAASLRDQIRRLERHPSVFDWMYGSDNPPPPKIERMYLDILKECEWPNPHQSSATGKRTEVTGDTGVKMLGPYEWVAPSYWLTDTKAGGAYGFNTETGPGPAPPPVETLRRMLPADHLWPIDSWWDYHAGGGPFRNLKVFTEALDARYGAAKSVEDYARKAQWMAYESHRAMFEAFGRNKYTATGVIQWMLNNAWPGMIWHLYDWYLRPGGSYFGAKKGCEPLHVQYSYDDRSIVVVNSYYQPRPKLKVSAKVLNLDATEKFAREATLDAAPDSSTRVFTIPEPDGLSSTYFVDLALRDAAGKIVSRNFYWLSTKPDVLDWTKTDWYHTPTQSYADFTALNTLPEVHLDIQSKSSAGKTAVTVHNPARTIAFAVRLKLTKGPQGEEVLPILWEDNYISLLPGETRELTATYNPRDLAGTTPAVEAR
jgi:exo-1,4-beta-D-glucosaminidase